MSMRGHLPTLKPIQKGEVRNPGGMTKEQARLNSDARRYVARWMSGDLAAQEEILQRWPNLKAEVELLQEQAHRGSPKAQERWWSMIFGPLVQQLNVADLSQIPTDVLLEMLRAVHNRDDEAIEAEVIEPSGVPEDAQNTG